MNTDINNNQIETDCVADKYIQENLEGGQTDVYTENEEMHEYLKNQLAYPPIYVDDDDDVQDNLENGKINVCTENEDTHEFFKKKLVDTTLSVADKYIDHLEQNNLNSGQIDVYTENEELHEYLKNQIDNYNETLTPDKSNKLTWTFKSISGYLYKTPEEEIKEEDDKE